MEAGVTNKHQIDVKVAEFDDLTFALKRGWQDFVKAPLMGIFFGSVFAIGGSAIFITLFMRGEAWLIIPIAIGFPLIAPFVAAGLYDISRRLENGESFSFSDILMVIWKQRKREMGWMAFVVLFVFWIWMYQVRLLLALFLTRLSFSSVDGMIEGVFFTFDGWIFLTVGTGVGAVLSTVLFSSTFISMPLLLDKNIDFVTAMITSFKTVLTSPIVLLAWGGAIAVISILSMLPMFLGLIIALPVFGHATWHLYRRLIIHPASLV